MPETKMVTFTHQELTRAMLREADIHEGLWGIYVEFGLSATNIQADDQGTMLPAAILPVLKIGIQRFPEPNSTTVDAADL